MPTILNRSILTAFCVVLYLGACAEHVPPSAKFTKVIPEHLMDSKGYLKPHSLTYSKSGKTMHYSISADKVDGTSALRVEIDFAQTPGSPPDKIWIQAESHAFIQRVLKTPAYTIEVRMQDTLFSGDLTPVSGSNYSPVVYEKTYPHAVFEPAIINYAIAALPLKPGYQASIPVIDLNNGSQMFWSNIRVLAEEEVRVDGVEFKTWKVESDGIRKKILWIDQRTKMAVKMKTDGNIGTWTLIPSSVKMIE